MSEGGGTMRAIMLESRLRKWWVTWIQSNGEVMIVGGNVGKIDPVQWDNWAREEPTGTDTVLTNGIIIVTLCGPSARPASALSSVLLRKI